VLGPSLSCTAWSISIDFINPFCFLNSYRAIPGLCFMLSFTVSTFLVFDVLSFLKQAVLHSVSLSTVGASYDPIACSGYISVVLTLVTLSKFIP